jgi:hypothetical protein
MPKARGQSSILQSENGDCTRSIQPRLIIRSEIFLIEGVKEVDEAIKNKQMSRVSRCVRQARAERPGPKRPLVFYDSA